MHLHRLLLLRIFQKCRGTDHSTTEQGLEQIIMLLKLKKVRFGTIDFWRFCFYNRQTLPLITCTENLNRWLVLPQINSCCKCQNNFTAGSVSVACIQTPSPDFSWGEGWGSVHRLDFQRLHYHYSFYYSFILLLL